MQHRIYLYSLFISLLILLVLHFVLAGMIDYFLDKNTYLTVQIAELQTDTAAFDNKRNQEKSLEEHLQVMMNLRIRSLQAAYVVDKLIQATPSTVLLRSVTRKSNKMNIDGVASSDVEVTEFINRIAQLTAFNRPILTDIYTCLDQRCFQLAINQGK